MRAPRPGAVAAASVFAAFGATLVVTGLARPDAPPVRSQTRWVPAEALVEAPASTSPIASPSPSLSTVDPPTPESVPASESEPTPESVPAPAAARQAADQPAVAVPVTLEIPRIGVRTTVSGVGRDAAGAIAVPPAGAAAGRRAYWYRDLAAPGGLGPAVIVGHVDSRVDGPAVFYRLGELAPGDVVSVGRADGSTVRFVVRALGRYPKTAFPGDAVYGPTDAPALRLITCGGGFDSRHGSYLDNLVVFATVEGG